MSNSYWSIEEIGGSGGKLYAIFYQGVLSGQALNTGKGLDFKGSGFKNPTDEELKELYKKVKK
jgi:hypothetical protein